MSFFFSLCNFPVVQARLTELGVSSGRRLEGQHSSRQVRELLSNHSYTSHPRCVQLSVIDWNSRLFEPTSEVWEFGLGLPSVLLSAQRGLLRVTRMPTALTAFSLFLTLGRNGSGAWSLGSTETPHPVTGLPQEVLVGRKVFSSHSV